MTSFKVFKIHKNTQSFAFDSLRNASKAQQRMQINCDLATSTICSASNILVSKISLQSIFFNKRAITDLVSFSLFSIKRFRLTSLVSNKRDRNPLSNKRDRKSSAPCVSASPSVNIRFIQSAIIECESSKKRKDRSSKNEADIIKQKSTATEKKRRDKSVKSNVASLNKEDSNSSIKKKTVNEMKDVKSIRFETMKKKKTRKKSDKVYRHARQCVKALRKSDTSSSS